MQANTADVSCFHFKCAAQAADYKVVIVERFDNIRVIAVINSDDIVESPKWNPDTGQIPLSVGDAINAVRNFGVDPGMAGATKEIEIKDLKNHQDRWHYLVKTLTTSKSHQKCDVFVVLMNGKVIPAARESSNL